LDNVEGLIIDFKAFGRLDIGLVKPLIFKILTFHRISYSDMCLANSNAPVSEIEIFEFKFELLIFEDIKNKLKATFAP
jgi:hypothetical protein